MGGIASESTRPIASKSLHIERMHVSERRSLSMHIMAARDLYFVVCSTERMREKSRDLFHENRDLILIIIHVILFYLRYLILL